MEKHLKIKNAIAGLLLLASLAGSGAVLYQLRQAEQANHALRTGGEISNEDYAMQRKFAEAYFQGASKNYKHAVQNYSQLLESMDKKGNASPELRAQIYFNIGNNLFRSGLVRMVNSDGSLQDDAKYAYAQAIVAYEQALKQNPAQAEAKFNLSLLHAVIPGNMQIGKREQTAMELSNLPIGLP
ncbi:hypothetical protein IHQ56_03255 [Methylobacillus flagellatus]|uniref:hypothetical protein n=1 Tax=Methylobacillus flagellatus TaxID=405 RepID=UPI0028540FD1|nr:hypothetical protein [Methylobacillus flagellatus]MDR5170828.1 hypothetical protein [Methylobacillus flagellatus]